MKPTRTPWWLKTPAATSTWCSRTRSKRASRSWRIAHLRRMQLVTLRRLGAEKIADEIIPPPARHVIARSTIPMPLVWQHEQIKVLVCLDERVHDQQRVIRRHVIVQRAMREQ